MLPVGLRVDVGAGRGERVETLGIDPSALRRALLAWKAARLAERDANGGPTPTAKKVYRLHLRTKRTGGLR